MVIKTDLVRPMTYFFLLENCIKSVVQVVQRFQNSNMI